MIRKILVLIFSVILSLAFSVNVLAEDAKDKQKGPFTVIVDTVDANVGDSVIVKLKIRNNPGVMAMTISITYDSSALIFEKYYYGLVFSDYTLKEHPDRNIIRLVICEKNDTYGDGAIIGIKFKIADDAEATLHKMTVEYSGGDFCNYNQERLMPEIKSGGVNVAYNGTNCKHRNYDDWEESMSPTCTDAGVDQRVCTICGHLDYRNSEPVGHSFSNNWTVDIPATKESLGMMSRHCIRCDASTDETNFSLEQSEEGNIENKFEGKVPQNDTVRDIILSQHPDININNPNDNSSSQNSSVNNTGENNLNEDSETQNTIGELLPDNNDKLNSNEISIDDVIAKIKEVFPKFDTIINTFKISIISLLIIILL